MLDQLRKHRGKITLIGDMLFSILVFPFAFTFMENYLSRLQNQESIDLTPGVCALYGTMAVAHLFRAFRLRGKTRWAFGAHLVYAAVFAACAALAAILGYGDTACFVLEAAFWACLAAERALAIARNHRLWSILVNLAVMAVIALVAPVLMSTFPLLIAVMASMIYTFLSVMIVIFSGLKLDILKEIVRKTYAAEIILGLLLLMVTFSYVLKFAEDTFTSFWDGLWYCFAVVTTIGFGDITPTSAIGRVATVILGVYGIVVVALITSIIVNFYGEMKKVDGAGHEAGQASEQDK